MTKEDLIKIAKIGFPDNVKQFIKFENCGMIHFGGVYRLYDKDEEIILNLPKNSHLTIFIGDDNFIQFSCGSKAFNHYSAIKEMEKLGLIK